MVIGTVQPMLQRLFLPKKVILNVKIQNIDDAKLLIFNRTKVIECLHVRE